MYAWQLAAFHMRCLLKYGVKSLEPELVTQFAWVTIIHPRRYPPDSSDCACAIRTRWEVTWKSAVRTQNRTWWWNRCHSVVMQYEESRIESYVKRSLARKSRDSVTNATYMQWCSDCGKECQSRTTLTSRNSYTCLLFIIIYMTWLKNHYFYEIIITYPRRTRRLDKWKIECFTGCPYLQAKYKFCKPKAFLWVHTLAFASTYM